MWYRIRQFCSAWSAKITVEDKLFVERYLSPPEQELFNKLNTATRKHSINVAMAAARSAEKTLNNREIKIVIKAALLHDIGKSTVNLSVFHKTLYVLLKRFFPGLFRNLSQKPASFGLISGLAEKMYIAENHARIGAALADEHGIDKALVEIIARHHDEPAGPLANIIKEADDLY